MNRLLLAAVALLATQGGLAHALPVDVSAQLSGSAGDWTVSFTVTNNLPGNQRLYFFGVEAPAGDITASPAGFVPDVEEIWENGPYGGSTIVYNNFWIDLALNSDPLSGILAGSAQDGFAIHVLTAEAPSALPWFAYASGNIFLGAETGCFYCGTNPGFESSVNVVATAAVPEPASATLALLGLFGLAALHRRP